MSKKELLTEDLKTGLVTTHVNSKMDSSAEQYSFVQYLRSFIKSFDFGKVRIDHLTNRIDLIQDLIT